MLECLLNRLVLPVTVHLGLVNGDVMFRIRLVSVWRGLVLIVAVLAHDQVSLRAVPRSILLFAALERSVRVKARGLASFSGLVSALQLVVQTVCAFLRAVVLVGVYAEAWHLFLALSEVELTETASAYAWFVERALDSLLILYIICLNGSQRTPLILILALHTVVHVGGILND